MKVKVSYTAYKEVTIDIPKGSKFDKWYKINSKFWDELTDKEEEFLDKYSLEDFIAVYTGENREDITDAEIID